MRRIMFLSLLVLLLLPMVAAWELNPFAEVKVSEKVLQADTSPYLAEKFNPEYGTIKLSKTLFWIESDKIAEYSLTNKYESIIDLGMYGQATTYSEGSLFDYKLFINQYGLPSNLREGKFYILVNGFKDVQVPDKTEQVCVNAPVIDKNGEFTKDTTKKCSEQVVSYKNEKQATKVWEEYKVGTVVPAGNYEWKFEGKREIGQIVDIQPVKDSKVFTEWVWYDNSWTKKQAMNVTETSGADLYNYQVQLVIANDGDMKADYSDLRFVNASETGEFSYWIENYTSSNVTVWVKFNKLTASTVNQFYMYYGNTGASTVSNGTSTFIQFGEFRQNGGTLPSCWYNGSKSTYTLDMVNGLNLTTGDDAWDTGNGVFNNCTASSQFPVRMIAIGATRWAANHAAYGLSNGVPVFNHIDQGTGLFYNVGSGGNFQVTYFTAGAVGGADSYGSSTATVKYRMELRLNATNIQTAYVNDARIGAGTRTQNAPYYLITGGYHTGKYSFQELLTTNWTVGTQPTYVFGAEQTATTTGITVINSIPLNNTNITSSSVTFGCNVTSTGTTNITSVTLNVSNSVNWTQTVTGLNTQSYNASFTNTTLGDGNYTWFCNATGTDANGTSVLWKFYKDSNAPVMTYGTRTETDGSTIARTNIIINVTSTDMNLKNITVYLYNSTYSLVNTSTTTSSPNYNNFTGSHLVNGTYYFNASSWDTFGNRQNLATQTVTIQTGIATISAVNSIPADNFVSNSSTVNFGCNMTAQMTNVTSVVLNVNGTRNWSQTISGLNATSYNATFTNTTVLEGSYSWNCTAYGNLANASTTYRTFIIDKTPPVINLNYPVNGSNYNVNTWLSDIEYGVTDTNLDKCWYSLDNGVTNITKTCNQYPIVATPNQYENINNYLVSANDTAGNVATKKTSFYAITNNPYIINMTANNTGFATNTILLNTFVNQSTFINRTSGLGFYYNGAVAENWNITFRIGNTINSATCGQPSIGEPMTCNNPNITASRKSVSETSTAGYNNINLNTSLTDGTYYWNYTITDAFRNTNTSETRTLTIDGTKPVVKVYTPTGIITDLSPGMNLSVNFSVSDANLGSCWIGYNGVNTTIPCNTNNSILYSLGINNLTVYANDTVGNIGNYTTYWAAGIIIGNASYTKSVLETSSQTFSLNYSLNSIIALSSLVKFYYNGSEYTSTTSCYGGVCTASNTIDIPTISGATQTNTFRWNITAYNGTTVAYQNSSFFSQNVSKIELVSCASGNITLNFTSYDEQNLSRINPYSFDGTFNYYLGSGTTYKELNVSNLAASEVVLCMNPVDNYKINSIIAYSAPAYNLSNYIIRNNFYQKHQINATVQDVHLNLLKGSSSTSFIIQVQDELVQAVPNVLIEALRCYPGNDTTQTAFISRTDSSGLTVGNFEAETGLYKFNIKSNDTNLLSITSCSKVVPQTAPYTLLFQLGTGYTSAFLNINNITNLNSSIDYNKTSRFVTYNYVDTSGYFSSANLVVKRLNFSGNTDAVICSVNGTLSSGTLTCVVPVDGTYSAGVNVYRSDGTYYNNLNFETAPLSDTLGYYGVFLGFFLIMICAFAFKFNEIAGIWLVNAAIFFCNYIGLINFGSIFVTASICLGIIITAVLDR